MRMRLCIRMIDHVSVCGVLISSGSMSTKNNSSYSFTSLKVSYYFSTESDLVWEHIWPTLHPWAIFHECQIVYWGPLNVKTSCPKKNKPVSSMCYDTLFGLYYCDSPEWGCTHKLIQISTATCTKVKLRYRPSIAWSDMQIIFLYNLYIHEC